MRVKTLLAGSQSIMRSGLRLLLERSGAANVVAEADDGLSVIEIAVQTVPDLVILDDFLPRLNGVEVTRRLSERLPHVGVVVLSRSCDRRSLTAMLEAGARGYLLRNCELDELLDAIWNVAHAGYYLCGPALDRLVAEYLTMVDDRAQETISLRERKVVQLLCDGKTTAQAAAMLSINANAVEHHRNNIMRKLGISSVTELVKYAIREGLTSIDPEQLVVRGRQEPK